MAQASVSFWACTTTTMHRQLFSRCSIREFVAPNSNSTSRSSSHFSLTARRLTSTSTCSFSFVQVFQRETSSFGFGLITLVILCKSGEAVRTLGLMFRCLQPARLDPIWTCSSPRLVYIGDFSKICDLPPVPLCEAPKATGKAGGRPWQTRECESFHSERI